MVSCSEGQIASIQAQGHVSTESHSRTCLVGVTCSTRSFLHRNPSPEQTHSKRGFRASGGRQGAVRPASSSGRPVLPPPQSEILSRCGLAVRPSHPAAAADRFSFPIFSPFLQRHVHGVMYLDLLNKYGALESGFFPIQTSEAFLGWH